MPPVSAPMSTNVHRQRIDFSRIPPAIEIPNLIEVQAKSYEQFLQLQVAPPDREERGLEAVFRNVFPIEDFNGTAQIVYLGYEIGVWECREGEHKGLGGPGGLCEHGEPLYSRVKYDVDECRERGMTYAAPLRVLVQLHIAERDEATGELSVREVREQKVYLGEIPLMTDKGTFIINGTERVIVSQMHRSPGVFFDHDEGKVHPSGKVLFSARVIPYRGSWLDFEIDAKDILYVRIDRRRKLPVTTLLRALGMSKEDILRTFYNELEVKIEGDGYVFTLSELLNGKAVAEDIVDPKGGEVLLRAGRKLTRASIKRMSAARIKQVRLDLEELLGQGIAEDIVDESTGEIGYELNSDITEDVLKDLRERGVRSFKVFHVDKAYADNTIRDTLVLDRTGSPDEALLTIYKRMRPGDPSTSATTKAFFDNLLFNAKRYDLSKIGRLKLNTKLDLDFDLEQRVLTQDDIIGAIRYLIGLRNGLGSIDDIDHLGNRRVRSVGELLENQFRLGLARMERAIKERMSVLDLKTAMPHDLINSKPVTAAVKEFFGSSQLSQFMDQTNPLSEITHKRRLSALGPGGLTRERAGFEVRDVHPTHYGRICPIETPEGPNIGLIASLSILARINNFGFIEVPYRKVAKGRVTSEIIFLTAAEEERVNIAQANAPVDAKGTFINDLVSARRGGEFILVSPEEVDYIDVSPKQLVSVAASLIPFLEHDDANRALMGSNMQRQAVPLLRTEAPLVGTGMEYIAARDSGAVLLARRSGEVVSVDATRIVVRAEESGSSMEPNVDIYNLTKYQRSNQNTCINQKPIVREGERVQQGQTIADGMATDLGELALGRNVLVAFMSWNGYNFEDSIVVSERLVKGDVFTSIHIEEFEVEARDTKQGKEEITRDIPNVGEDALRDLDESGIIRIGATIKAGDILVGKVTPKGETQLSPEEKLLKAIFGEKAGDVRDTSLTVPPGVVGTVIDVKVFSRKGIEKDSRALTIEEQEIEKIEKDFDDEIRIVREEHENRLRRLMLGKTTAQRLMDTHRGVQLVPKAKKLTEEDLATLGLADLARIKIENNLKLNTQLSDIDEAAKDQIHLLTTLRDEKVSKLRRGDELPPGVIKLVKVYVAIKRKLEVGDKMAGRHGNKGVVSRIVEEEDMPHLEDGTPIEIILNPLGVPSRMNVGQILETTLGWAAHAANTCFSSAVFDGATEEDILAQLQGTNLPASGQMTLIDGREGQPFDQQVLVGHIYMMKLHHLVDDKIHARSTGPYSLVTQQPLGGKAQFGGQRLGEMEVWALEAYGAASTLQEMLTVKSDDVSGRTRMYEAIVKGTNTLEPSLPESFNVLVKELQSLALDVELIELAQENGADGYNGSDGETSGDDEQ